MLRNKSTAALTALTILFVVLSFNFAPHSNGALALRARTQQVRPSPPPPSPPKPVEIGLIKTFIASLWRYAGNKEFMRLIVKGNLAGQMAGALQKSNAITLLLPNPDMCKTRLSDTSPYARNNKSLELIMGFHIITGAQLSYSSILAASRTSKVRVWEDDHTRRKMENYRTNENSRCLFKVTF